VCKFKINTPLRLAHFLAQCAHESANFTTPREVASGKAYEGRKDLGNTQPGDGPRYKGRGYIQLTGRVNYRAFSKFVPEDCEANPELVADKYPLLSAAWYWTRPRLKSGDSCLTCSDKGDNPETVLLVSKLVNGVNKVTKLPNGLSDRQSKFNLFNALA
jgi:putative chitinase